MGSQADRKPTSLAADKDRVEMLRRHKRLSVSERIEIFERLSRNAAWAKTARRVR